MKIVIAPEYADLTEEIIQSLNSDYPILKNFCHQRNIVDLIEIKGEKYVIKRYKKPIFINRIIYSFFRKTKARRAFENANCLLTAGINTPKPVAYIEKSKFGLFRDGYFISEYSPLPTLYKDFYDGGMFCTNIDERKQLCADLSMFVYKLHQLGIQPLDMNTTNIMYEKIDGKYRFTLIDINRMKMSKKLTLKQRMATFTEIGTYANDCHRLLYPYATALGADEETCVYYVAKIRMQSLGLKRFKRWFRREK